MGRRPVVTIHLPMPLDELGRLGEVLDELWPGCIFETAGTDLLVFTGVSIGDEATSG